MELSCSSSNSFRELKSMLLSKGSMFFSSSGLRSLALRNKKVNLVLQCGRVQHASEFAHEIKNQKFLNAAADSQNRLKYL